MTIIHHLTKNNNYSRFNKCPMCGSSFNNKLFIEDDRMKHLTNEVEEMVVDDIDFVMRNKIDTFEQRCSNCTFNVIYKINDKDIKKVN